MPNPSFDECAVIEKDTDEGLARVCHVISSRDCMCLKHTEFHTELARPAGTERYWFSNRVERGGRKCSTQTKERKREGRYVSGAAHARGRTKKAEWESVRTWPLEHYQSRIYLEDSSIPPATLSHIFWVLLYSVSIHIPFLTICLCGLKWALSSFNKMGALRLSTLWGLKAMPTD